MCELLRGWAQLGPPRQGQKRFPTSGNPCNLRSQLGRSACSLQISYITPPVFCLRAHACCPCSCQCPTCSQLAPFFSVRFCSRFSCLMVPAVLLNHSGVPANCAMRAARDCSRPTGAPFVALNARCSGAPPTQHLLDVTSTAGGGTESAARLAACDHHTTPRRLPQQVAAAAAVRRGRQTTNSTTSPTTHYPYTSLCFQPLQEASRPTDSLPQFLTVTLRGLLNHVLCPSSASAWHLRTSITRASRSTHVSPPPSPVPTLHLDDGEARGVQEEVLLGGLVLEPAGVLAGRGLEHEHQAAGLEDAAKGDLRG